MLGPGLPAALWKCRGQGLDSRDPPHRRTNLKTGGRLTRASTRELDFVSGTLADIFYFGRCSRVLHSRGLLCVGGRGAIFLTSTATESPGPSLSRAVKCSWSGGKAYLPRVGAVRYRVSPVGRSTVFLWVCFLCVPALLSKCVSIPAHVHSGAFLSETAHTLVPHCPFELEVWRRVPGPWHLPSLTRRCVQQLPSSRYF